MYYAIDAFVKCVKVFQRNRDSVNLIENKINKLIHSITLVWLRCLHSAQEIVSGVELVDYQELSF
jgi:hypothetical protein